MKKVVYILLKKVHYFANCKMLVFNIVKKMFTLNVKE